MIDRTPKQIAEGLLAILGSQSRVAEILGLAQPNVSRYLNDPEAETIGPVAVLAERVFLEAWVRLDWISQFLIHKGYDPDLNFELVRTETLRDPDGTTRVVDRIIEVFVIGNSRDWPATATEAAKEIVANYLPWGWTASGDFFGFYRRDGADLYVVSFTVNGTRRPRASIPDDPIFGTNPREVTI